MVSEKKALTVTALTKYIKYKFDHDIHLSDLLLEGEISNFKRHSRGHFYFTLKDKNAQISATMFYNDAKKVSFEPKDGMKVLVRGNVSVYEPQGTYSINVITISEQGLGSLYLAYEKLKKELSEKGYFDEEHKKKIPLFPKAIGVITSKTGAAVKDCINTIRRRFRLAEIYVYPTLVQGDGAKNSIVNNIKLANKQKLVDVLIVGRGGGSIEDLWAFNEEVVAKAIYDSQIPIISAVGHETDFTISDFVADKRAATPTAAAELATPDIDSLIDLVNKYNERVEVSFLNYLKQKETNLLHLDKRLEASNPLSKLDNMYVKLNDSKRLLDLNFNKVMQYKVHNLDLLKEKVSHFNPTLKLERLMNMHLEYKKIMKIEFDNIISCKEQVMRLKLEKLKALNPLAIMEKGFSVIEKNKHIVKSSKELDKDDIVTLKFIDGKRLAKVMEE